MSGLWAFVEISSIIDKAPETVEQVESELLQQPFFSFRERTMDG